MISGLSVPIHLHVVYVIPCMCGDISYWLILAMNMRVKVFDTFKVCLFADYSGYLVPANGVISPKMMIFFRRLVRPNYVNYKNPCKCLIKIVFYFKY